MNRPLATTALLLLALSGRSPEAAMGNDPGRAPGMVPDRMDAEPATPSLDSLDVAEFRVERSVFARHLASVLHEAGGRQVLVNRLSLDFSSPQKTDFWTRISNILSPETPMEAHLPVSFATVDKNSGEQDRVHCRMHISPDPCSVHIYDCKKDFLPKGIFRKRMEGFEKTTIVPRSCADAGVAHRQEPVDERINDGDRRRESHGLGVPEEEPRRVGGGRFGGSRRVIGR